ncbi:AI-2E family transporter [Pseudenhygromyxa sp. WMMC2535]|uniref:AI-2E family transporter n=1 Tax=Pseudenhygromyxa sp. WMMC2535 TaxID=2712867 RepID=UPI0015518073|nr:AI-2E family transporter [Pseudenhygromyxa sp. WMMC2535]NVB42605.1 AI-2E family transporter [Pseudenhygromyxa sp. WMMC2535]
MSDRRAIGLRVLITGASMCVVIAGLREAGPILVPVLFSAFLAILAIPPVNALQRHKVPDWLAVTIVVVGVLGAVSLISLLIGSSIAGFSENLDTYEAQLKTMTAGALDWIEAQGFEVSTDALLELIDPGAAADFAGGLVTGIGSALSNTAFVLLTTAFIMAEAAGLPRKLQVAMGANGGDLSRFTGVVQDIQEYLWIKTKISVVTGLLAWLLCLAVGVDYPVLWGVIAFFLNYIPTLGSILAALPAVLLGFVQFGWERAAVLMVGYLLINTVMGNIVEPKVMGKRLGLSSLVVFLSLVFWGWIWGTLGMFLSVPLTMVVKILLENSDDLKWVAVLLGSGAEMEERLDPTRSMRGPVIVGGTLLRTGSFSSKGGEDASSSAPEGAGESVAAKPEDPTGGAAEGAEAQTPEDEGPDDLDVLAEELVGEGEDGAGEGAGEGAGDGEDEGSRRGSSEDGRPE